MTKEDVRNIIFGVCIIVLLWMILLCATEIESLNKENKALTEQVTAYEQKALDWQVKAEATEIKLAKAEGDLQNCSERMEELEILIFESEQTVAGLESKIESLETTVSNYNESGEWDYAYTDEDVKTLAAVMYAENYISGRWEMMLTGSVVLNRVKSPKFPNTIHDVVYQKNGKYEQYAPRTKGIVERVLAGTESIPHECYSLARILLDYGSIAPANVIYQAHFNQGEIFWDWNGEEFCYG